MDLTFKFPGIEYSVDSIMMFENNSWLDSIFHLYPQIDKAKFDALLTDEKRAYLQEVFEELYENGGAKEEIAEKLPKYNAYWKSHKNQIEAAFSDAFDIDVSGILNDMVCNVTFSPINPRFLSANTFEVTYLNSERGVLGVSLHEIVHFVWFYAWQKHFKDDEAQYETPHLKWIFSEMVVDAVMRNDARLAEINPYYQNGLGVYEYFYKMTIDGKPILDTLHEMYSTMKITDFMEHGYAYCKKYEIEIRAQME